MDVIAEQAQLPDRRFAGYWDAIKVDRALRERLVAQAVLALTVRQRLTFEMVPVHGLIVLSGPPGTGKTSLARGLANEVARALIPPGATFVQIDPHALTGTALGHSQAEVMQLFRQTLPGLAAKGPLIVLLDEVETLIADRLRLSLETNPIDVHRATDAALVGLDRLCRENPNILLVATTNFPQALDAALLSRADLIEEIGLPNVEARQRIIAEILEELARHWPGIGELRSQVEFFAGASAGVDGRRLRKAFIAAIASTLDTARDPNKLKATHVIAALQASRKNIKGNEQHWTSAVSVDA